MSFQKIGACYETVLLLTERKIKKALARSTNKNNFETLNSTFCFRIRFVFGEEIGFNRTYPFQKLERAKNLKLLQIEQKNKEGVHKERL